MSTATPYTPITLDAVGEAVDPPFDLRTVTDSVVIACDVVSGTPTYVLEVSNDERTTRRYIVVGTFTTSVVKRLRGSMPRFVRVRFTSGAGQVDVALGKARNSDGSLAEVNQGSLANA